MIQQVIKYESNDSFYEGIKILARTDQSFEADHETLTIQLIEV